MGFMLAAGFTRTLEFFAHTLQKSLVVATCGTRGRNVDRRKKARQAAGLKSKDNLKNLKN
jgi:hypothetical protein